MRLTVKTSRKRFYQSLIAKNIKGDLFRQLSAYWSDAVGAGLVAISKRVRVDTGMSAASLLPLAEETGVFEEILDSIRPKRSRRSGHKNLQHPWSDNNAKWKTLDLGYDIATKALRSGEHNVSFGTENVPQFNFRFEIVVFQYHIHELGPNGNNWRTLNTGNRAIKSFLKTERRRYISGRSFIEYLFTGKFGLSTDIDATYGERGE